MIKHFVQQALHGVSGWFERARSLRIIPHGRRTTQAEA